MFLLSLEEARDLFTSDTERLCTVAEYALNNGIFNGEVESGCWWLRSPGNYDYYDPMSVVMAQLLLEEIMSPVNVELSDLRCG